MKSVIGILSLLSLLFISCSNEDATNPIFEKPGTKNYNSNINKALYVPPPDILPPPEDDPIPYYTYFDEKLSITKEWDGNYGWIADTYISEYHGYIGIMIDAVGSTLNGLDQYVINTYVNYDIQSSNAIEAPFSGVVSTITSQPGTIVTVKLIAVTPGNTNSFGSCTAKIGYTQYY